MVIHGQFIPVGIPVQFSFCFVKETPGRFPQLLQLVIPPWSIFIPLGSAKGALFCELYLCLLKQESLPEYSR